MPKENREEEFKAAIDQFPQYQNFVFLKDINTNASPDENSNNLDWFNWTFIMIASLIITNSIYYAK